MPMPPFPGGPRPSHGMRSRRPPVPQDEPKQFESLRASLLFCPKCQTATPYHLENLKGLSQALMLVLLAKIGFLLVP